MPTLNSNNTVIFEGKLANDPFFNKFPRTDKNTQETKETAVVRFTVALDGGKDGSSNETVYVPCEAWDTAADIIADYKKGDRIAGFGILRNNKWKDKETQEERKEMVIRVSRFFEVNIRSRDDYEDSVIQ